MNAATKLALAFLAMFVVGLALIVFGLWPRYHFAATIVGIVSALGAARAFAALWKLREPTMARECAWCGTLLGSVRCSPAMSGTTSHGICDLCERIYFPELSSGAQPVAPDASPKPDAPNASLDSFPTAPDMPHDARQGLKRDRRGA